MDDTDLKIRALEAEMVAMMGIVTEVLRGVAAISPKHRTAVCDGFDEALRALTYGRDHALHTVDRENFAYALRTTEWLTLSALAPKVGGKTHGTVQ